MPTDSKKKKLDRRMRRDKTLAYRMLDIALAQRDEARVMVMALQQELRKYLPEDQTPLEALAKANPLEEPLFEAPRFEIPEGSVTAELAAEGSLVE